MEGDPGGRRSVAAVPGILLGQVHAAIDWSYPPEWLDKEFQALFPLGSDEDRRRTIDKLAKVRLKTGEEEWIITHVEVQGDPKPDFEGRMFRYSTG